MAEMKRRTMRLSGINGGCKSVMYRHCIDDEQTKSRCSSLNFPVAKHAHHLAHTMQRPCDRATVHVVSAVGGHLAQGRLRQAWSCQMCRSPARSKPLAYPVSARSAAAAQVRRGSWSAACSRCAAAKPWSPASRVRGRLWMALVRAEHNNTEPARAVGSWRTQASVMPAVSWSSAWSTDQQMSPVAALISRTAWPLPAPTSVFPFSSRVAYRTIISNADWRPLDGTVVQQSLRTE